MGTGEWQSGWQTTALKVVTNVTDQWKAHKPGVDAAFNVNVQLPFVVTHAVVGVDLDFVIQGVDYAKVAEDKSHIFAANLVSLIQDGLWGVPGVTNPPGTKADIQVTLAPGTTPASMFVTARFPYTTATVAQGASDMEKHVLDLLTNVQTKLTASTSGLKYFTSWTTSGIKVTLPGVKVDS